MNLKNIPNKIFLNIGFKPEKGDDFNDLEEVTWCVDKVDDNDIEYQRKPVWHDLRKDAKDLPAREKGVLVIYENKYRSIQTYLSYHDRRWWCGDLIFTYNVIAWMSIPKFE